MTRTLACLLAAALAGCMSRMPAPPAGPTEAFHLNLAGLCGAAYAGRMVTRDPADAAFAGQPLRVDVRCIEGGARLNLAVGEDRSRTWVVTRQPAGMRLKHEHRHADGSLDVLTNYGGDAAPGGSSTRQSFPADAESIALFRTRGNPASVDNVWTLELRMGETLAYELRRPGRHFRVEFDLSRRLPSTS